MTVFCCHTHVIPRHEESGLRDLSCAEEVMFDSAGTAPRDPQDSHRGW